MGRTDSRAPATGEPAVGAFVEGTELFDRRYPIMRRLDEAPIDWDDRKRAMRVADAVRGRTECGCAFNVVTGALYFYLGNDVGTGVWAHPYRRDDGSFNKAIESEVDDICAIIRMARVPLAVKERVAAGAARDADSRKLQERGAFLESRRGDAIKTVRKVISSRGQSKHARPSALVNGLKGVAG